MDDKSWKRCRRPSPSLPDDILMQIFSRLPLDSALRCRCVCKAWLALLTHDHLNPRDYIDLFPRPTMSGFFYCRPTQSSCHYAPTYPHGGQSFRLKPPIDSAPLPLLDKHIFLLDSCNGLLLFGRGDRDRDRYRSLLLCNPAAEKANWATVDMNIELLLWLYPEFRLLGAKLLFDRRTSPVHFECLLFFYNWQDPSEYPVLITFSSDTGNCKPFDVHVRGWGPELDGDGSSWSVLLSGVGKKSAALWPYRYHRTSPAPARRLMGESRGLVHMAVCDDRELRVWALGGACTWELKHKSSSRALVDRYKESHRRQCAGARNYSILSLAFHPDFDVVFLQIEWRIYSLHLSSGYFDEVAGERGANPWEQRFVFCPFAGDPLANFGGKTEYDQLSII